MKKSILFTAGVMLFSLFNFAGADTVEAKAKPKAVVNMNAESDAVFHIPHQDDDVLTFGVGIINHVKAGHNVHVVLQTDGSSSIVRERLGMTREQFSKARTKEFIRAMLILGVERENIHFENVQDGSLTVEAAKAQMKKYEALFPGAKHKAFSYTGGHHDHINGGKALAALVKEGVITDARFYVQQEIAPEGMALIKEGYDANFAPFLMAAAAAYEVENPINGLYGIGYKSVPRSFDAFKAQPVSRYHK